MHVVSCFLSTASSLTCPDPRCASVLEEEHVRKPILARLGAFQPDRNNGARRSLRVARAEAVRTGAQPPPPPSPPSISEEGTRPRRQPQRPVVEGTLATDVFGCASRTPLDMDPDALSDDISEEELAERLSRMALSPASPNTPQALLCDKPDAIKFGLGPQALSEFTLDAHEV